MLTCACCPVKHGQPGHILLLEGHTAIQVQLVDDRVSVAIDRVAGDRYVRTADGRQLPQTSKPELIATMLRLLDVQPDHRVLKIGTGSGYSTALLAHLVGAGGQVISLDIDPEMVTRASRLLALDGHTNVTVWRADGRRGYPPGAPYDRLVAWAQAPHAIPAAWTEQVHPGGIIVAALRRRTPQVVRMRVLAHHQLSQEQQIATGFIPLTAKPLRPWEVDNSPPG